MTAEVIRKTISETIRYGYDEGRSLDETTDAVLALVGPRELKWSECWTHYGRVFDAIGPGTVYRIIPSDVKGFWLTETDESFDQLGAAQSAAQAHADAAHWSNTALGYMIGGEE
jgi:hypothetical protein